LLAFRDVSGADYYLTLRPPVYAFIV